MIRRLLTKRSVGNMTSVGRWTRTLMVIAWAACCAEVDGQQGGFNTVKLEPAQWAAFNARTGDLATLDVEDDEVYVYPREYFAGNKDAVRGPWKGDSTTHLCFAYAKKKTWIAVSYERGSTITLLDPQTLEVDAQVRTNLELSIGELNGPTDPECQKLFYQTGRDTGLIDLATMQDRGLIQHPDFSSTRFVPSHDGKIMYHNEVAVLRRGTEIEVLGKTYDTYARTIVDQQQQFASTGYAVLTADFSDIVTEFDYLIFDFAPDGSIVAGLDTNEDRLATLCLGSLGNFETLVRVPLPAIFAKSVPKASHFKVGSKKSNYDLFVDSSEKRVLVFHSGWVASYDYSNIEIPHTTSLMPLASLELPEDVLVGQHYEINFQLPAGTTLQFDPGLSGAKFADNVLTWDVKPSDLGPQQFRIQPENGAPGKAYIINAVWPHLDYSFYGSGAFDADDLLREHQRYGWKEPRPSGLSADNRSIALWYANSLLLLDAETAEQQWAHRFDLGVANVAFGQHHLYVQLKDKVQKVVAVSRDDFSMTEIDALSGQISSNSSVHPLRLEVHNGIVAWTGITQPIFRGQPRITACSDATLEPIDGALSASIIGDRVTANGFEFGQPDNRPILLAAVQDPLRSFSATPQPSLVPAFSINFYPSIKVPSRALNGKAFIDYLHRVGLAPGEGRSSRDSDRSAKLVLYRFSDGGSASGVRISTADQQLAQIGANDKNIFYCTDEKIYVIPFAELNLPVVEGELQIERRQSTFLAQRNQPVVLNYKISGGTPPYQVRAACWLGGEKPDSIQRKIINTDDGAVELSFSAFELKTAALAYFTDGSLGNYGNQSPYQILANLQPPELKQQFENFTNAQSGAFELATGRAPTNVPVPLPVRIQVIDNNQDEVYLGHYLFHEVADSDIQKAVQQAKRAAEQRSKRGGVLPRER